MKVFEREGLMFGIAELPEGVQEAATRGHISSCQISRCPTTCDCPCHDFEKQALKEELIF